MDIAIHDGYRWGVVDADWPQGEDSNKLDTWINFIRQERLKDDALSSSGG